MNGRYQAAAELHNDRSLESGVLDQGKTWKTSRRVGPEDQD